MINNDSSTQTRISLMQGQAHCEKLQLGTVIRVAAGTLSVTSHVWLENTLLTLKTPVHSGGVYSLTASGWCELTAQSDVELWIVSPARRPLMASLVNGFMRLLTLKGKPTA